MDQKNLADLYKLDPIPWSVALEALESGEAGASEHPTQFLATTRPDGRPHLAGVGAVWDDGKVYFVSGDGTRKSQNLARNADCSIAMSFKGIDLVIEGTAVKVTDDATLHRVAKVYAESGWPAVVKDGAFTYDYSAPSAGPPPVEPLRGRPEDGLRRPQHRTGRCHALAVLEPSPVGIFAFIHGAGDVGWYWHLVEAELRARGHDTVAPDLPIEDDAPG